MLFSLAGSLAPNFGERNLRDYHHVWGSQTSGWKIHSCGSRSTTYDNWRVLSIYLLLKRWRVPFWKEKSSFKVENNWESLRWHKEISENGRNSFKALLWGNLKNLNQFCLWPSSESFFFQTSLPPLDAGHRPRDSKIGRPSHPHLLHGHTIKATNVQRPKTFLELQSHFVQYSHTWETIHEKTTLNKGLLFE